MIAKANLVTLVMSITFVALLLSLCGNVHDSN